MHLPALIASLLTLLGLSQPAPPVPAPAYTLIRCGTLLDVPGRDPRRNVTLVIKDDRVHEILDGLEITPAFKDPPRVIDLSDCTVLPGLIDCHVHLTHESSADARLRRVTETDADAAIRGAAYARRTLNAGFTTVRDLGASAEAIFALRDGIARGDIPGPRIVAAGKSISITGGHGDPTNGYREDLVGMAGEDRGIADGPESCMRAVRHQIKLGADVIKITATGGVLSVSSAGLAQHFTDEELAAIVKAAHAMGRRVAAHAHGTDGIKAALRAGVDSVEHATMQDEEAVSLFKQTGAWYVPTLLAGETVLRNAQVPGYFHGAVVKKVELIGTTMRETFRRAHAAGVNIAFGTDSGVSTHGTNAEEFVLMVECGMTPADAIRAATVSAAECLGLGGEIGALEPGRAADVIAVRADPLADVAALKSPCFVMKGGSVHRHDAR